MQAARNWRYSPVNWLIIDWSQGGRPFDDCGLPEAPPCPEDEEQEAVCKPLPIQEAIDTYDWSRFLPEVMVGIEDPDEEIAANYIRQAAIEFAQRARVLQRQIVIQLQPDSTTYPVFPYPEEQIIGVIGMKLDSGPACPCMEKAPCGGWYGEMQWRFDAARNELHLEGAPKSGLLYVLVWSASTEDACAYDKFLYDRYRRDITYGARRQYAEAVHFRDRLLIASLPPPERFERAVLLAKRQSMQRPSMWQQEAGSGLFGNSCCFDREDYYFHKGG